MIILFLLMKEKLKAILFDLDDTLYLERDFVKSGFKAISVIIQEDNGISERVVFDRLWSIFKTGKRKNIFDYYINEFEEINYSVNELVVLYRTHTPNINLIPGIEEYLLSLNKDYKLGLITDGFIHTQKNKINALGLNTIFDEILITDGLGREFWKPSIVPFSKICDKLEVCPSEAIYIGDNPKKDFKGPKQLGMGSIRLRLKEGEHYESEPYNDNFAPVLDIYSVENLKAEIKEYNV